MTIDKTTTHEKPHAVQVQPIVRLPDGYYPNGENRPHRKAKVLNINGTMARVQYCDDKTISTVTIKAFM
jgi:hypothetical protein